MHKNITKNELSSTTIDWHSVFSAKCNMATIFDRL